MTKVCSNCGIRKDYSQFNSRGSKRRNERSAYCKDCISSISKKHREFVKIEVFTAYGGVKCNCCGEDGHLSFLALDHIENNGHIERLGYPKGYQVLCHNCNSAKEIMGECPHKTGLTKLKPL